MTDATPDIVAQLARERDLDPDVVLRAVQSQYRFAAEGIASGEFPKIYLMYLGTFVPNMTRKAHIDRHNANKTSDDND